MALDPKLTQTGKISLDCAVDRGLNIYPRDVGSFETTTLQPRGDAHEEIGAEFRRPLRVGGERFGDETATLITLREEDSMKFGQKALMIAGALALGSALMFTTSAKAADNDHYAGYQIKAKLPSPPAGTIGNPAEATGAFDKCKAKFILFPTTKNGGAAPANPALKYLCWQCKGGKPAVTFSVTDQFAGGSATTKKLKLICNSATTSL